MAEELQYETEDGKQLNEIRYRRTVRGIPSPPMRFYVRNLSDRYSCQGNIHASPVTGMSYSEDFYLGSDDESWGRSIPLSLGPGDSTLVQTRVIPRATPAGITGKATLVASVTWSV